MKDKEMIEEMAKIIDDCTWVTDENYCESISCEVCHAKRLYEQGYRKIDKDSVVLSREEWKQIKNSLYYSKETLEKKLAKKHKETAEKIILPEIKVCKELYDLCNDQNNEYRKGFKNCCRIIQIRLNDLAKQFGVEIKE